MSLRELIASVEDHEKVLTVFNGPPEAVERLREYFADRNLRVRSEQTPSGKPGQFVTLSEDGEVLTATALGQFRELLDDEPTTLGLGDQPYQPLLEYLDGTMFTSWETAQLVAASREIEDRAWRIGSGTIHAGFQYLSTLRKELPVYERLASAVDVHLYATPDEALPDHDDVTLHVERSEELERSWFVVFDGGASGRGPRESAAVDGTRGRAGTETGAACALVAEERTPRSFYGFWTYDRSTVDWIVDHLDSTYNPLRQ